MVIKALTAAVLFWTAALSTPGAVAAEPGDAWRSLQFLVGTWEAKTQGGSSGTTGSGAYTFGLELKKHILARHSGAAYCKGSVDFDCNHADLLYVFQEAAGQSYKAIYFDSEGHVIHYDVSTPGPNRVIFVSNASLPGPQFRLSYALDGSVMTGKFQMRMPGQTEFTSYLEWSGTSK
jgi:hypothetical protein